MSRQDQERVNVTLDGIDLGVFSQFEGGAKKSDDTKDRPGGMGPEESLGGLPTRDPFTVSRRYKLERDHPLAKLLDSKVGSGRVVAVRQMLNPDKSPAGEPITFTGTLMEYVHPNHDANSGDRKTVALQVSADEPIS
jgi:hypothetical protein